MVTPYEGLIVNGECVATTELTNEQVSLELDVSTLYLAPHSLQFNHDQEYLVNVNVENIGFLN